MKKIGLITTLGTNIGDDFIREGICRLLADYFHDDCLEFVPINKHRPYTVYPQWHPVHLRSRLNAVPSVGRRLDRALMGFTNGTELSHFDRCHLIVQCGAPVFWPDCRFSEWAGPLWHDVIGRLHSRIPVLNLAAGSCYPWERQPVSVEPVEDREYLRKLLGYCHLTTVRDTLAESVCNSLGTEVPLIPCSAFLAGRGNVGGLESSGYIFVNYMAGGGHYSWDQDLEPELWEKTLKNVLCRLGRRHRLAFLCHDDREYALAGEIAPALPRFRPRNPKEYLECISRGKFGICNRMHASVVMAGIGIPSVAICTDTRLLMVAELGLPTMYVKAVTEDLLEEMVEQGVKEAVAERERLLVLQDQTWNRYLEVIEKALSSA